jgi:GMP synthase PP-ATPase subunit
LKNWLINIAGCKPTWTTANIAEDEIEKAKSVIGDKRVICGLSGGVDSAVAAAIIQRAVGKQLTCVFVDHGFFVAANQSKYNATSLQQLALNSLLSMPASNS